MVDIRNIYLVEVNVNNVAAANAYNKLQSPVPFRTVK